MPHISTSSLRTSYASLVALLCFKYLLLSPVLQHDSISLNVEIVWPPHLRRAIRALRLISIKYTRRHTIPFSETSWGNYSLLGDSNLVFKQECITKDPQARQNLLQWSSSSLVSHVLTTPLFYYQTITYLFLRETAAFFRYAESCSTYWSSASTCWSPRPFLLGYKRHCCPFQEAVSNHAIPTIINFSFHYFNHTFKAEIVLKFI